MAQPGGPVQSLDYQPTPSGSASPHRIKACRHALGNGVGFLALSLLLGAGVSNTLGALSRPVVAPYAFLTVVCFSLNAMAYCVCGMLYILASVKIRRPNNFWEKTFLATCGAHLGAAAVLLALIVMLTNDGRERFFSILGMLTVFFNFAAILALVHMFTLALYTHLRCS